MSSNLRKFAPLGEEARQIRDGDKCGVCKNPFNVGDVTTLIPLGPGDDPEEQEKARKGDVYTASSVLAHWSCATGEDPNEKELLEKELASHAISMMLTEMEKRDGQTFQRCTTKEHLGMTFRCPRRRPNHQCIECVGCAAESDSDTCGSFVHTINPDGTYGRLRDITEEEWEQLQEFPLPVHTLIVLLGQEKQKFNQVKKMLKE